MIIRFVIHQSSDQCLKSLGHRIGTFQKRFLPRTTREFAVRLCKVSFFRWPDLRLFSTLMSSENKIERNSVYVITKMSNEKKKTTPSNFPINLSGRSTFFLYVKKQSLERKTGIKINVKNKVKFIKHWWFRLALLIQMHPWSVMRSLFDEVEDFRE